MLDKMVVNFIQARRIDSFQKLYVLLFLYQHPKVMGSSQDLAKKLNLGPVPLVEKILNDLHDVGLVSDTENRYKLCNVTQAEKSLQSLTKELRHPQGRQAVLEQVGQSAMTNQRDCRKEGSMK